LENCKLSSFSTSCRAASALLCAYVFLSPLSFFSLLPPHQPFPHLVFSSNSCTISRCHDRSREGVATPPNLPPPQPPRFDSVNTPA
uniref:Uncharacterized protein n=1 Tax=Oryza brachyantha TaxID=4533 RepID=J3MLB4_ORYBR